MRIAIMGAGGVGGYFGARLAMAGEDVTFIARGPHLEAIRERGLTVVSDSEEFTVAPAKATEDTASLGAVDAVLFCVKLYDTAAAAKACLPLIGDNTFILTFQNGIESVDEISRIVGPGRVLGGAVYIVVSIAGPGVIRRTGPSDLMEFGEPGGVITERARNFATVCEGAGLNVNLVADMRRMIWKKFVLISATSSLTALTRQTVGTVREDAVMRGMLIAAIAETVRVARKLGVDLADDIEADTLYQLDHVISRDAKASQLVDLERGARLELEWLSGAVHRLGAKAGVATPVHSTVYAALRPFMNGRP